MRIRNAIESLVLFALASSIPALASAQDRGWYAGGSIGASRYNVDTSSLFRLGGINDLTSNENDTGWKIYGGYHFNRNWAVEAGYADFGTFKLQGSRLGLPFNISLEVTALTAAGVGTMPLNGSFALLAKAGLYLWDSKVTSLGSVGAAGNDGVDPMIGVGARYNLTKNVGLQAEFEYFGGDDTVNLLSVGLRYKF